MATISVKNFLNGGGSKVVQSASAPSPSFQAPTSEPGLFQRIGADVKNRQQNFNEKVRQDSLGKGSLPETALNFAGNTAGLGGDIAGEVAKSIGLDKLFAPFLSGANAVAQKAGETIGQGLGAMTSDEVKQHFKDWLVQLANNPNTPRALDAIKSGVDVGVGATAIAGAAEGVTSVPEVLSKTKDTIAGAAGKVKSILLGGGGTPPGGSGGAGGFVEKLLAQPIQKPVESVLKETPVATLDEYANIARKATESYKNPTPLEVVGQKAQGALDTIQRKLSALGQQKKSVMSQAAVGNKPVGDIVMKYRQELGNYLKSKTAVEGDAKMAQDIMAKAERLGSNPKASEVDQLIDYVQDRVYTGSRDLTVPVTDQTTGFVRNLTGKLNDNLKSQLPSSYRNLNEKYAQMVGTRNELNLKLGKEGERGGALMKRVFSPSDANTKKLFADVKTITGVDLTNEATLARFVMETMGDARQASMLEQLQLPNSLSKSGILNYAKDKISARMNTPEKILERARNMTKDGAPPVAPTPPLNPRAGGVNFNAEIGGGKNAGAGASENLLNLKIHPEDAQVMRNFIDAVRTGKEISITADKMAQSLMEHYGINPDAPAARIADKFDTLLAKSAQALKQKPTKIKVKPYKK